MIPKIHLAICENYEPELQAVLAAHPEFGAITCSRFPCHCGSPPLSSTEIEAILPAKDQALELLGDCCLSDLRGPNLPSAGYRVHATSPCFRMFTHHESIEKLMQAGAYITTPGWLARWREKITDWKFSSEKELRAFLKETSKSLVLLDTGVDPNSNGHLLEFAKYVGLPHETIIVGLDFFSLFVERIVLERRLELERSQAHDTEVRLNQQSADYAMTFDLLSEFSQSQNEEESIRHILNLFKMLFAPQSLDYISCEEEEPLHLYSLKPGSRKPDPRILEKISELKGDYSWNEARDGFLCRITQNEETLGIIIIEGIAFPQYGKYYLNLIHNILPICGLSITNARNYQQIKWAEEALRRANRQLKKIANIDGLTLIANRRSFDTHLQQEWQRAYREKKPISLFMMDIDFFKYFNDTYGHQAGDDCLQKVARIISGSITRPGDLAARYGGEEFTVILPNTPANGAMHLAGKLQNDIQQAAIPHGTSKVSAYVTLSIGVATLFPDKAHKTSEIVAMADKALYEAKQAGRNRIIAKTGNF